jgi:adenosylhomocysteine nucleosidase
VSGILILTAVELEARVLARRLELPPITVLPFPAFGRGLLRVAPVGLRAGLLLSRWPRLLAGFNQPLVISSGICGALAPDLSAGDLVLPESVLGPSGERLNVTPTRHRQASELGGGSARGGTLVTSREVVATAAAKAALFASTGAVAVDMESSVILAHAAAAGCPTLVVRGVSDRANESVPLELIELMTPAGKLRPVRVLALTVTRPRLLPRALALRQATRRALTAVARVLAGLAASPRP